MRVLLVLVGLIVLACLVKMPSRDPGFIVMQVIVGLAIVLGLGTIAVATWTRGRYPK